MKNLFKKENYPKVLLILFLIIFLISAVNPNYMIVWVYENIITIVFLFLLIITYKKFKFSNLTYTLLFILLVLHAIGSHYSYSEMPLFDLIKDNFNLERNNYDRLVHFLFGFIFYFPVYEIISRKFKIKSFWVCLIAFLIITGFKGIYEIIEYVSILISKNDVIGTNFLGMQGDQWDAQKDMILGMIGALLAWIFIWIKDKFR